MEVHIIESIKDQCVPHRIKGIRRDPFLGLDKMQSFLYLLVLPIPTMLVKGRKKL